MENYKKIKDSENYYRDLETNAVINFDHDGYKSYVNAYRKKMNEINNIKKLEHEVESIKSDLSEIKILLKSLNRIDQ